MRYTKGYTRISKLTALFIAVFIMLSLCSCNAVTVSDTNGQEIIKYTLPPVEEEPVPVQGGELTFPIPMNPATLNPLKTNNVELYNLFSLIYEQPLRIGADGIPVPELAETWEVDDTGTEWTFNLRKGVSWQKEKGEFTSSEIIYTIGLIKSYTSDECSYARYNGSIKNYTAEGDYAVKITLSEPGNAALYFMTFPVLCREYCESGNIDNNNPVGTGPYIVSKYDKGNEMLLIANETWWKQSPYITELTAKCYPDHDTELIAFEQKFLDFLTTSSLSVDTYLKYGISESKDYLTQYYDCIVPNSASGLFSDINMRRAVAFAIDKRDIVSKALLGHAVATDYPVLPGSHLTGGSTNIYEYNLQKASALFEQAGWKDRDDDGILEKVEGTAISDLEIKLLIPLNREDTYRRDVAENIADQLTECGIQVNIVEASNTDETDEYRQGLINGSFDLALCSFYLDSNPDISFMIGTGGSANFGGFSDTGLDTLLKSCSASLSEDEMEKAYLVMESLFLETVPQISLYFRTSALLYDASINIIGDLWEKDIFATIPDWYMYVKEPGA